MNYLDTFTPELFAQQIEDCIIGRAGSVHITKAAKDMKADKELLIKICEARGLKVHRSHGRYGTVAYNI